LFWNSIRLAQNRNKTHQAFSFHTRNKGGLFSDSTTEGPEFLPCPFSGGTAWFFLPLVERYLALFSVDLSIALDPDSGCRALPFVARCKARIFDVANRHCAIVIAAGVA